MSKHGSLKIGLEVGFTVELQRKTYFQICFLTYVLKYPQTYFQVTFVFFFFSGISGLVADAGRHNPRAKFRRNVSADIGEKFREVSLCSEQISLSFVLPFLGGLAAKCSRNRFPHEFHEPGKKTLSLQNSGT